MTGDMAKVRHIAPSGAFNGIVRSDSRKVIMMKISKSKQELARIISENGGWRGAANIALFGKVSGRCYMLKTDEWPEYDVTIKGFYINARDVVSDFHASPFTNWHQTILSRAEYFHLHPATDADGWIEWKGGECPVGEGDRIDVKFSDGDELFDVSSEWGWGADAGCCNIIAYRLHKPEQAKPELCESVMRTIPEPEAKPTIDQLLQDWRNADDLAKRKQAEAYEAAAMRGKRWQAVQDRAGEVGVTVGLCESAAAEPEQVNPVKPVMTGKFRNAKIGSPKHYISNKGWSDEICDECGKRFGAHFDTDCHSQ